MSEPFARHALTLTDVKKHSVRYDPEDNDEVAVTALYVKKAALPMPYPEVIVLTLETIPTS